MRGYSVIVLLTAGFLPYWPLTVSVAERNRLSEQETRPEESMEAEMP